MAPKVARTQSPRETGEGISTMRCLLNGLHLHRAGLHTELFFEEGRAHSLGPVWTSPIPFDVENNMPKEKWFTPNLFLVESGISSSKWSNHHGILIPRPKKKVKTNATTSISALAPEILPFLPTEVAPYACILNSSSRSEEGGAHSSRPAWTSPIPIAVENNMPKEKWFTPNLFLAKSGISSSKWSNHRRGFPLMNDEGWAQWINELEPTFKKKWMNNAILLPIFPMATAARHPLEPCLLLEFREIK
ncbi:hypothetical protein DVH24_005131 [Malus domestica]|uniref:Uncharacterized protein n=1 Tax=Malus domestica TaxID=3750 RepID=A0A498IGU4_MALDO|nr:hypothetical protein DVH24_005131 [Malus domestica]